jgi:hypothetical protein
MAIILDIAGKPTPPRNRSKNRWRAQDARDLTKVLLVLSCIILGYFVFVPNDPPQQTSADRTMATAAQDSADNRKMTK